MDKFDKLFHIRKDRKNRLVPIYEVLDNEGKFHAWLPKGNEIIDFKVIDLVEGEYFAKKAYSAEDIYFGFINFLYQRSVVKSIFPFVDYITNDMHNLATSLRKLEIYYEISNKEANISRFVISELEYILVVCRSMYDYFQCIAQKTWDSIKLIDKKVHKKSLSASFSKMVLSSSTLKTSEEISVQYGLTPQLAKFYTKEGLFFQKLRNIRDDIMHRGFTPKHIYVTDKGFSVNVNHEVFSSFNVWTETCYYPNDKLASLKPVIAYIIRETFGMMSRFVNTLKNEIKFPDDIAPGYHVFMRGKNIHKLAALDSYIEKDVWYSK